MITYTPQSLIMVVILSIKFLSIFNLFEISKCVSSGKSN